MHIKLRNQIIRDAKRLAKETEEYKRKCKKCGKMHKGQC